MALSFIASSSTQATTITIPGTYAAGDLLVIFAWRNGSTTPPSLPAGWTNVGTNTGTTSSVRVGYKVATSNSQTSGTWTNATTLSCSIYRGQNSITPFVNVGGQTGTSPTVNYSGITTMQEPGRSWVVRFAGIKTNDTALETPCTGDTFRSGSAGGAANEVAAFDTNGAVSSSSFQSTSVGGTAGVYITFTAELKAQSTTYMEAGSASTQDLKFMRTIINGSGAASSDSQAVQGSVRSFKALCTSGVSDNVRIYTPNGTIGDSGSRFTCYVRFSVVSPGQVADIIDFMTANGAADCFYIALTNTNKLAILDKNFVTQATGTTTIAANTDYRLSCSYTIQTSALNLITIYLNGVQEAQATNITVTVGTSTVGYGMNNPLINVNTFYAHIYMDNGAAGDIGDVRVTAKRPNANGTTNGFTTQIGSGGSGYGSGHSPQVNERPLSETNGWSMVGAGSAVTEEYSIENASTGDVDISSGTIVDYMGWMWAKSLSSETASLILNNVTSSASLTSTSTMFTQIANSTSYPGGGTDIGVITTTALTTVSLFETGIMFAYTPGGAVVAANVSWKNLLGVGQ